MFYCSEPFYLYDHHILTDIFSDLSLQVSTSLQVTCLQAERNPIEFIGCFFTGF